MARKTTYSTSELAKIADVEPRTIQYWVKEGLPRRERGTFGPEALEWVIRRMVEANADRQPAEEEREYRARKALADAQLAEEKLAILRKENIPIEYVEDALSQAAQVIRTKLLALPTLARRLVGRDAKNISKELKKKAVEILEALSSVKVTEAD